MSGHVSDATVVRQAVWEASLAHLETSDKISISKLEVTVNAGVDAWGRKKAQRALVSVALSLSRSFDSAAESDTLNNSTVHYGKLSKHLQSFLEGEEREWVCPAALTAQIVQETLQASAGTEMCAIQVDVDFPKASLLGDGVGWSHHQAFGPNKATSFVLHLRNLRMPCLIGINANERLQKQALVVNLWIERCPLNRDNDYTKLEATLVEAISNSSFETLEALSTKLVQELRQKFFTRESDRNAYMRLRVEKPLAVPYADAPAIEIMRRIWSQ